MSRINHDSCQKKRKLVDEADLEAAGVIVPIGDRAGTTDRASHVTLTLNQLRWCSPPS
jgi:hypothetical protein